ncbi:MAG: hypothetical protein J07HQX50_01409 [Haloquadratum sp. J07HQX50]|jgi:hypothetical protein|nr:MAG: hypothetical protein J07HQX50_01409 [Haloquadratum sp. J07HQX50]
MLVTMFSSTQIDKDPDCGNKNYWATVEPYITDKILSVNILR